MLMAGRGLVWRGRSGRLLIFRFTPRGLRGLQLETTRSCMISSSTQLWNALLSRRGIADEEGSRCPGVVTPVGALLQKMRTWAGKEGDRSQNGLNHQPKVALPPDSQSGRPPYIASSRQGAHRSQRGQFTYVRWEGAAALR
jgi:hypothetical protein